MSTLKLTTLQTADGLQSVPTERLANGTARAWVSFNGTGTVAIRSSYNVSSITDHATGEWSVNYANAMPDANYSYTCTASTPGGSSFTVVRTNETLPPAVGSIRIQNVSNAPAVVDSAHVCVAIHR